MRGLIVLGVISGLLLTTTATATGGTLAPRTSDATAKALTLPSGDQLNDQELAQVTGQLLPVWAAAAIVLAGRAIAAAIANAAKGALIGAPSGALAEAGRQLHQGEFNARALGCAALGGAIAGAMGGPLDPGAKTVSGVLGLGAGGYAGSWCGGR